MKTSLLLLLFITPFILLAQPTDGLVGYYSFDDFTVTDATEIGGDGTIYGSMEFEQGISGACLSLDGDDYVIFEGDINNYFHTDDFSYSFFISGNSLSNTQSILGKRSYCNGYNQFDVRIYQSGIVRCAIAGDGVWQTASINVDVTQDCWEMITFVREGVNTYAYYNGELFIQGYSGEVLDVANSTDLSISNSPCIAPVDGTERLTGKIDELRIYDRALSHEEVAELYEFYMPKAPYEEILFCNTTNVEVELETTMAGEVNWYDANGSLIGEGNPTIVTLDANPFIVAELIDEFGCLYRDTVLVSRGESIVVNENITICEGEALEWGGQTYTEEGFYDYTTSNEWGCEIGNFLSLTVEVCGEVTEENEIEDLSGDTELKLLTYNISIFNLNGSFVKTITQIGYNWEIPNQNLFLAKGAYIASIEYINAENELKRESVKFFYAY